MSHLRVIDGSSQMAFNYDGVSADVALEARQAAERISLRLRRTAEDIIEIGRDLMAVQDRLPHGSFHPWLEAEFGMSKSTAYRFIAVAEAFGGKSLTVRRLDAKALYELAAPKTPLEVREEVERMIEAGEVVPAAKIAELKREFAAAEAAKTNADRDMEAAKSEAAGIRATLDQTVAETVAVEARKIEDGFADQTTKLEATQAQLEEQIARLRAENARLKAQPAPVAPVVEITEQVHGNVVTFTVPGLSDEAKAAIDAEADQFADADFNETAGADKRARVVTHAARMVLSVKADPQAVYRGMTEGKSKQTVSENKAMVDAVFTLFQSIKDQFDGKSRR